MTDGQRDLFGFVGAALAVMVALFTAQEWYASMLDLSMHAAFATAGVAPELQAARDADAKKLASGKVPLDQAMRAVAERGRGAVASVRPAPSDDLSAMSGWIHRRGFSAYTPRVQAAPAAPAPEPVPVEGAVPPDGADPGGAAPAPAEAKE